MSGPVSFACGHVAMLSAGPCTIDELCPPCAEKQPKQAAPRTHVPEGRKVNCGRTRRTFKALTSRSYRLKKGWPE